MNLDDLDNCPNCGSSWKGRDIFEHFMIQKIDPDAPNHDFYGPMTVLEIYGVAKCYGYSINKPKFFRKVIGVKLAFSDPDYYDGISFWMCPDCNETWNRKSGKMEKIPGFVNPASP